MYGQTQDYEVWCDDVFYDRNTQYALLHNDIQLLDTLNGAIIMGDKMIYHNEPRSALVLEDPVFGAIVKENGVKDTIFITGDTLKYYDMKMCDIDSAAIALAKERVTLSEIDAIENIKENMRKAAKQKEEANKQKSGGQKPPRQSGAPGTTKEAVGPPPNSDNDHEEAPPQEMQHNDRFSPPVRDSLFTGDSLFVTDSTFSADSISVPDSIPIPPDTTHISFVEAYHNVKIYKDNMQGLCDSLFYSDLDSMARLFINPVLWNEIKNQLASDSMQIIIKDGQMRKGLLLSNAFITTNEGGEFFNQIKAPEMVGYFEDGALTRFDALGGASMIFYLQEDTVITTMNKKECKIITSTLRNGELYKNHYYNDIKSNAFPIYELTEDQKRLKDFSWRGDERPTSRYDITTRKIYDSMREETINTPFFPQFRHTQKYFPDYIKNIMKEIDLRKPLKWKYIEVSDKEEKEIYKTKGKQSKERREKPVLPVRHIEEKEDILD